MSTSLLYHAFGIRGYRYLRTDYLEGEVVFTIEQGRPTLQCPLCGSREVIAHGAVPFADPQNRHTHAFARYALDLSAHMTIQDVAQHLGVSWDTIKDLQKQ